MARLLITDDDPAILGLIRAILEPEGFEIAEAHNGIEAVEAVEHSDFDLIILDIMMPEMDGLEACRRIRQFSDVPIIFLSAKDEEADTRTDRPCARTAAQERCSIYKRDDARSGRYRYRPTRSQCNLTRARS